MEFTNFIDYFNLEDDMISKKLVLIKYQLVLICQYKLNDEKSFKDTFYKLKILSNDLKFNPDCKFDILEFIIKAKSTNDFEKIAKYFYEF